MSSVTAVYVVYIGAAVTVVLGFAGQYVISRYARLLFRLERLRHQRAMHHQRRRVVVAERAFRAFEDPCWRMFRHQEADHARALPAVREARLRESARLAVEAAIAADRAARDARAVAALRRDLGPSRPPLVAVPDVREAV